MKGAYLELLGVGEDLVELVQVVARRQRVDDEVPARLRRDLDQAREPCAHAHAPVIYVWVRNGRSNDDPKNT